MTQTPIPPTMISRITQAARYVISGVAPDAWFGPLQPPAPIAPPEVAGRRFDYPTGYNLSTAPRSYEPVSFEELRALADSCDILRSVIETRKDQIEAQEWTVRVAAPDTSARIPQASDDQKRRIDMILAFLHSPDKEHGFEQWLRLILEDMFVIDGVAIYKRRTRAGGLYALEVIDAATIKILLDDSGRVPLPPNPGYQQILKGVPAADYTREELMYLVHNPRSHKVYGYSHVEQILLTVNILIRRALHQLEYYREGSQPEAFMGVPREWTGDQIATFQNYFDGMLSGNLALRRRVRFMPGDFKYQETKQPPLKDAYDEYLARIICFVFSISPEPFVGQVNRATAQTSHARAVEEGLAPLMRFVRGVLNRIIACDFASPDLEFAWTETRAQDPAEAAQIDVAYVGAGILTVNEVRANMGLPPVVDAATPSPVKKNLRKDDDDDESDDDSRGDDDSESGDDDDSDSSGFDSKQPRWAAGSPGGIGGEFAPKDAGDATGALHDAIAQDAQSANPLNPDSAWAALASGIDRPSQLGEGTMVAQEITPPVGNLMDLGAAGSESSIGTAGESAAAGESSATASATSQAVASDAAGATIAEAAKIVDKAVQTTGSDGEIASTRNVAEQAAKDFVGENSEKIFDRQTGDEIGEVSEDGTRVKRFNNANKPDPYINLENKPTGGNLHVRWSK